MPLPIALLLALGAAALVVKAVADRNARYDEPANTLDDSFDHMMLPGWERDRQLRDKRR